MWQSMAWPESVFTYAGNSSSILPRRIAPCFVRAVALADSVLHFGAPSSTRIIVEFPSGMTPPAQGSTVTRDEARPYEITEVRKQSDGQLNVFVREIMQ